MRACLDCNARVCYTETIRIGPAAGGTRAGAKEGDKMTESRLLPQRESLTVEFKSDKARLPDGEIFETVVGLANTEGGDLYLGVEDSGAVSGLHRDHRNPVALSTYIASNTVPPLSVRTELVPTEPPVLRISVPKMEAGIASTTTGKTLHRRLKADGSPETVPLYPYEFASRLADLRRLDYTALPVPEASAADFDPLERERLRRILVQNTAEKGLLQLSDDALYRALGLVRRHDGRECPTVAGLLLLGRPDVLARLLPTAASSFQELEGTRVRVNEDFLLPVLAALEKQFAYLDVRNGSTELALGPFRLSVPDFDRQAVREAIVNAYCHRDYARMQRVRLCLTEEGLTIANPGGFRSGTNLAWLYDAEPDSRNLLLSDVLKRIGLAERTGLESQSFVNGITYIKGLTQYRVTLDGAREGQELFQTLADAGISVSCLNLSLTESMFSVYSDKADACAAVLERHGFNYKQNDHCAKVSVVGISVRGMPGLMASFVNALNEKGIAILQTVDSNTSISAIIKETSLKDAVVSLHEAYKLNR